MCARASDNVPRVIHISKNGTNIAENKAAWKILHECLYHHQKTLRFLHDTPGDILERIFSLVKQEPNSYNNISNLHCIQYLSKVRPLSPRTMLTLPKLLLMEEGLPSQKIDLSSGKDKL